MTFAGASGKLQLDQSVTFTSGFQNSIVGFGGSDQLDLRDIGYNVHSTLGYLENDSSTGGTLTVSDGISTARIALLGQYMTASFNAASDGHGGTMITDPPLSSDQSALVTLPSHA